MTALSLRTRLTIWYAVAVLVALAAFAADVLVEQQRLGIRRVDRELQSVDAALATVFEEELGELGDPAAAAGEAREAIASLGDATGIFDSHGAPLAVQLDAFDVRAVTPLLGQTTTRTVNMPRGRWRVHAAAETIRGTPVTLVAARPLTDITRERAEVGEAMLVVVPFALMLAGAGGWWLASVGLRPVRDMARRASSIPSTGADDLGPPPRDDELGQLAHAFNGLVARLRGALQTQQQFMADASHELRTPVSIIRSASEVTLDREHRAEREYREALAIAGAQARHLGRLVEDMLVLARADAGAYPLHPVTVYLDDVVEECRRAVNLLAGERGVMLRTTGASDISIRGDEELLRRLMVNLLQNAVQHSPCGGTVSVDVGLTDARVVVRVSDTGPGIPEADRTRIFERFVQLDPSRRAHGTGLGLPIAKWIAEAHHGTLDLEAAGADGCTFTVVLPVTDACESNSF
jgi:heavy metal sensor kinase